ncbi:MAG: hypothetical protein OHK0015_32340 [Chloroflexi bacterium OHK40]
MHHRSARAAVLGTGSGSAMRVLVLDSDPGTCRQLALSLERNSLFPIACTAVCSAEEARALVQSSALPYEAILVDQHLGPGPDGISELQTLLTLSPTSGAIVFTRAGDIQAGRRAHAIGAYRYLHKPFTIDELLLVLETLRQWLQTRKQVTWLQVVNAFAEDAQHLHSRHAIERIIVQRGLALGFDRARLYVAHADGQGLVGAAWAGGEPPGFTRQRLTFADSPYLLRVSLSRYPVIFDGLEHGETGITRQRAGQGYPPPRGEWVALPLRAGDKLLGVLALDRTTPGPAIRGDQLLRQALVLFGRQVGAAIERAALREDEQRRSTEATLLARIAHLISGADARRPYSELLEQLRQLIAPLLPVDSFFVAMLNEDSGWLELLIDVENGRLRPVEPLPPGRGLTHQILVQNRTLCFNGKAELRAFREAHAVQRVLQGRAAQSWLGVPLQVEGRAVGALVVQSTESGRHYTAEHQRFLEAVAAQISGPLHNRRLREAAEVNSRRLAVIHQGATALMQLTDPTDEYLWHVTLTIATAGYGLGYNLAMVFLLHRGGTVLRGRMAIGQGNLRQARRSWAQDEQQGLTFERYLELLLAGRLRPTPLDGPARQIELSAGAGAGALGTALERREHVRVRESDFSQQIPPLLQTLLPHGERVEYDILPILVGNRCPGVVLVGNPHLRRHLDQMPLDQLRTWLSLVAAVFESRRQRRAGERLARVSREILARAADQPLKATLTQICESARVLMGASCAVIYPLAPGASAEPRYLLDEAGTDGLQFPLLPTDQPGPHGVTRQLIHTGNPLCIDDVAGTDWYTHGDHASLFLRREGIRAFVAIAIFDHGSGEPRGVLFVSYRSTQRFGPRDEELVRSFAELAGQAIRNRADRALIEAMASSADAARRQRERELQIFTRLLSRTLELPLERPETQLDLVHMILLAGQELLDQPDVRLGLVLRLWERDPRSGAALALRREFFLVDGELRFSNHRQIFRGITGRAFERGEDQLVDDVTTPEWRGIFYPQLSPDTRSELDVLVRLDGRVIGLLNVESPRVAAFTREHQGAMRRLADITARALETSHTQQHIQGLLQATRSMIAATDLRTTLQAVLNQILRLGPELAVVTIWYWESERQAMVPGVHHGVRNETLLYDDTLLLENTVLGQVVRSPEPIWAEDVGRHPVMNGRFVNHEEICSAVAFPLRVGDGNEPDELAAALALPPSLGDSRTRTQTIGALFLNYRHPHRFTRHERVIFPLVAAIVAACIRDALAFERLRKQRQRLAAATELARAVGATLDLDRALEAMLRTLRSLLQNRTREIQICVLLADERETTLTFTQASRHFYDWHYIENNKLLPIQRDAAARGSIASRVARRAITERRPVLDVTNDTASDPDYVLANAATCAQLSLALLSPEHDRLLGVLVIESSRANSFDRDDELLIESLGPSISLAIARARENADRRFHASVAGVTAWVGEIAHDIGTVISDARRALYRLQKELDDEHVGRLGTITESLSRLRRMTTAPFKAVTDEPYDLNPWLHAQIRRIVEQRAGRPVSLTFELSPEPLVVEASELLLDRALSHLVRNARQVQPIGCVIRIRTFREGSTARIWVQNNGPEIPEDLQRRLFVERIEDAQREDGEGGLGLLLSRWVMRTLRGDIELVSPRDPVTFGLWLPLVTTPAQENV